MFKFILIMFFVITSAFSVQPMQKLMTFTKKDGSTFKGFLRGDEYLNWIKTEDGKLITFNNSSRKYEYLKIEEKNNKKSLTGTGIEYFPSLIKKSFSLSNKIEDSESSIMEEELFKLREERKEKLFLVK